jgi:hypothetical protein
MAQTKPEREDRDYALYLHNIELLRTVNWLRNYLIRILDTNWDFKSRFNKVEYFANFEERDEQEVTTDSTDEGSFKSDC